MPPRCPTTQGPPPPPEGVQHPPHPWYVLLGFGFAMAGTVFIEGPLSWTYNCVPNLPQKTPTPTHMRHIVKVHPGQKLAMGKRGMFFPVDADDPRAITVVEHTAIIEGGKLEYIMGPAGTYAPKQYDGSKDWSDPATATPLADFLAVKKLGEKQNKHYPPPENGNPPPKA